MSDMAMLHYFLGIEIYQKVMEYLFAKRDMLKIFLRNLGCMATIQYQHPLY